MRFSKIAPFAFGLLLFVPAAACSDDDSRGHRRRNDRCGRNHRCRRDRRRKHRARLVCCVSPPAPYNFCNFLFVAPPGAEATCLSGGNTVAASCPAGLPVIGCCRTATLDQCNQSDATGTDLAQLVKASQSNCKLVGGTWTATH